VGRHATWLGQQHGPSGCKIIAADPCRKLADVGVRIPRDGDQRSELMSITIPK